MTRLDNEKFKNGSYKIESRLKASDKKLDKAKSEAKSKALEAKKGKMEEGVNKIKGGKVHSRMSHLFGMDK